MQGKRIDGEAVNQGISDFKFWFKDFMIEISPLLAFIGFLMLVVDINVRGGLATSVWFEVPWAIVQAIAVEGLLFAIWFHIFGYVGWTWGTAIKRLPAIAIGLCMATVGIAMVDVAMYQEMYNVTDSVTAMAKLHIPIDVFMHSRSVLIVVTSLLAIPFGKRKVRQEPVAIKKKATIKIVEADRIAIPEIAGSHGHSLEYEKIKQVMAASIQDGKLTASLQSIAREAEAGYSTVKKHAPKIKQELGI